MQPVIRHSCIRFLRNAKPKEVHHFRSAAIQVHGVDDNTESEGIHWGMAHF